MNERFIKYWFILLVMAEDIMENHKPSWTGYTKLLGGGFCVAAVISTFGGQETYAQTSAIMGPGLIGVGYLGDLTAYAKAYFNERLDILKNQSKSGDLEKKLE